MAENLSALIVKTETRNHFQPYRANFLRDLKTDSWQEADIKEKKINPEQISLVFLWDKEKYLWCQAHQRYEKIHGKNMTEYGCKVRRFCAILKDTKERLQGIARNVSFMWEAEQTAADDAVEVAVYCVTVRTEKKFIWSRFRFEYVPIWNVKRFFNRFYMDGKNYECEPRRHDAWILREFGINIDECPPAFKAAMLGLQGAVAEVHKVETLLPDYQDFSFRDVWTFIRHPYDFHIASLQELIGRDFYRLFPREKRNNYDQLCYYLHFEPPKSLRKEYLKNPFSLVIHLALLRVGFEDLNAIHLFKQPEILHRIRRSRPFFDYRYDNLRYVFPCREADLRFFIHWMKEQGKDEMVLARQMAELMKDGWAYLLSFLIVDFHEFFPILREETKQLVKRRGISKASAEVVHQDIMAKDIIAKVVEYQPHVLALNDKCENFDFHVVTDTMELPQLGRAMSNCVATYYYKMIKGQCIIVAIMLDGGYAGCIELRPVRDKKDKISGLGVFQALGRFNKLLEGNVLQACREWAKKHKLELKCEHLD